LLSGGGNILTVKYRLKLSLSSLCANLLIRVVNNGIFAVPSLAKSSLVAHKLRPRFDQM
jgi:hypothetical protein